MVRSLGAVSKTTDSDSMAESDDSEPLFGESTEPPLRSQRGRRNTSSRS